MLDSKNFFDQAVKSDKITYENIRKLATGQRDDYTIDCLLDCAYFKNYYKMKSPSVGKSTLPSVCFVIQDIISTRDTLRQSHHQ